MPERRDGGGAAAGHGAPAPAGAETASEATVRPASPGEVFRVFTGLALQGFGGVLPVAQRVLVDRRRWLSPVQFVELLSAGQVLPGPNVVNLALMVGDRFFGWRGALAALAGMLSAPLVVVLVLAALYARFEALPVVAGALRGMGAVAAGLVLATALRLLLTLRSNPMGRPLALLYAALTAAAVGGLRWPLLWVLLGLGTLSLASAWRAVGPTRR